MPLKPIQQYSFSKNCTSKVKFPNVYTNYKKRLAFTDERKHVNSGNDNRNPRRVKKKKNKTAAKNTIQARISNSL